MSKPDDGEENWITKIDNLCSTLNVDPIAAKKAKDSFLEIKRNYTLDGDPLHWIACAMYVACRTSITPTVQTGKAVEGNCVSLTRLLRICNIRISHLEHKFAVSTVLFRKFQPIFQEIFSGLTNEPMKNNTKSKKPKLQPCTSNALFEFTWCLYICVKGEFHSSADDLVDMYHILLSCLDFVFANAFMSRRIDLINPGFKGEHANEHINTKNKVSGDEISEVIATFGPRAAHTGVRSHQQPGAPGRLPAPHAPAALLTHDASAAPCTRWMEQFCAILQETNCSNETVKFRCNMVTCLYYKIFEHIIKEEHRKKPHISLQVLVSQQQYQLALFACCAELVLHAYGVHSLRFPRLLRAFQLSALSFYKIIELVVQCVVDKLSRDLIKHLNAVEEEVLESLVWTSDSPLWERLEQTDIPASADVYVQESPLRRGTGLQSPVSTIGDRFLSPMADHAKKQLFKDNIKPGQSLLVQPNNVVIKQEPLTPTTQNPNSSNGETTPNTTPNSTPKKVNNSLVLFFRKFYSLAVVRMNDLCTRLRLTDDELKRKIWTCLEHSIMKQTHLMKDRHLDQILMCSVYVICKVSNNPNNPVERTFADIMRCYRQRPLADNHVYRSVLIKQGSGDTCDNLAGSPERGDLINFYNKVYVQCMQTFALRFTGRHMNSYRKSINSGVSSVNTSGYGCCRQECGCRRAGGARGRGSSPGGQRVSERHQLLKPRRRRAAARILTYRFSRSPAKVSNNPNNQVERTFADIMRCYRQRPLADNHVYRSVLIKQGSGDSSPERGDLINFYNKVYVQCMQTFALRFTGRHMNRVSERHQLYVKPLTSPPPAATHLTYRFSRSPAK
ncbi:hypothetical protein MSG28_008635, partial [Choristoneura fumiferana]